MTDQEIQEKQAELIKVKKSEIKERIATEIKAGFLNPFDEGVSYKDFLTEVEKSKKSVAEYCKGKISEADLEWLEADLLIFKNNQ